MIHYSIVINYAVIEPNGESHMHKFVWDTFKNKAVAQQNINWIYEHEQYFKDKSEKIDYSAKPWYVQKRSDKFLRQTMDNGLVVIMEAFWNAQYFKLINVKIVERDLR